VLNAFDDNIEFISYSLIEIFPFLGHHRRKEAMAKIFKVGYGEFDFTTYGPVFNRHHADIWIRVVLTHRVPPSGPIAEPHNR